MSLKNWKDNEEDTRTKLNIFPINERMDGRKQKWMDHVQIKEDKRIFKLTMEAIHCLVKDL